MKLEKDIEVKVYSYKDGFRIHIITLDDRYEAWLGHEDYSVMSLMDVHTKYMMSVKTFTTIVERSADEVIERYKKQYIYY